MLFRFPRRRRAGTLTALTLVIVFALGASSAQATVTTSTITTPSDGSTLFQNYDTNPNQTFTVSGTTDQSGSIDIVCYHGTSKKITYAGPGPSPAGISVSGGSFSVAVPQEPFGGTGCHLLAIPHNTSPSSLANFSGPRVGFSEFESDTISSGPNNGERYDYWFADATPTAVVQSDSINSCGPYGQLFDGTSAMDLGPWLFYCAGQFYNSKADFSGTSNDMTRSEIQIDGQNSYGSLSAKNLGSGNSGLPPVTATVDSFNTTNGDAQVTESESLVKCAPNDVYNPSSSDCSSFVGTGVSISRVTRYTDGGHVQTVTDSYTSTDGATHNLSLLYETDLNSLNAGWELPGQSALSNESTGNTGPAPSAAPGSVYAIDDTSQSPSLNNPVGAMTFAQPYDGVRFDNTVWSGGEDSALFDYERTVKSGSPVVITWSYATESSLSQVQSDASAAQSAVAAPAVKITSPKKGAVLGSKKVTVKGIAGAGLGVASVTVNGVAAKLSGDKWTAPILLKKGKNLITVLAANKSGTTSQTTETVTYGPVVKIASSRDHYKAGKTKVKLTCSGPSGSKCKGTLTLTKAKGGHRLGHASYTIKTGHHKVVSVKLPKRLTGKIHANARATVKHGGSAKRKIILVG